MSQTATRTDRLNAAHEKLSEAVESISSGDDWKRMLEVVSKFHRYSFNNHLMIFLQRPDATVVAGFNRWKSLGRSVKKGEKGIAIFAPLKNRVKVESSDLAVEVAAEPNGEDRPKTEVLRGFRVVHVFDTLSRDSRDWALPACGRRHGRLCRVATDGPSKLGEQQSRHSDTVACERRVA